MQNFTKTDEACTCKCHTGTNLYHVVVRPCCESPIDGGKQKKVFELEHDEVTYPVMGESEEEAKKVLDRFLTS